MKTDKQKPGRARNKKFTLLRDRALCARFYYHSELHRRRFDDVINILSYHEFFIGEQSIKDALNFQNDYLSDLMNKKPTADALKKKYPCFAWVKNNNFGVGIRPGN